jgi:hypothetical protein
MLLNQLFSPKKLFEGGNLASHKADGQPMPGWQGIPGQHQAQELDLNVHNRTYVVDVLSDLLHKINDVFAKQYKEPLWHENSVQAQKFLSGSTAKFFDKKISDEEFLRVKPKVGDIDTQAPDKHAETIQKFLTSLIGKRVGDAKFIGFSAGNNQYTSMWEVLLKDLPVKLQIDFEYGAHDPETGLPTDWQEYSHSSSWEDLSAGIKGVFHKYIDRALPYASTVSTKYVARVLKKSTKISDEPVTDSDYSFAVSGQGGGGVSRKYVPYNDPATGAPMERDGIPVMQLLDPANRQYIQNLGQQFEIFFGRKPKGNDQQLKNSFVGTVELANKYLDDQQRAELFNRFVSICFEPGSQMITKGDPARDRDIKMAAIDYMIQNMKLANPQAMRKQAIKTATEYEQAFTSKQAGKGLAENNTAAGINKMFNNLGDPVFSNLQRVALLAMQGRQQEASGRLQNVIKDASPKIQQKIIDAVNNIKPVTVNGKIADSSTLDKSKQHQDWIIKTFIPWVQSLLDKKDVTEAEVKAQFRKGMPHLHDLKPADLLDLLDEIHDGNGSFKLQNIPLNVKVDGFGGRFGKNSEGKPFMGTSRTEPRYAPGFVDYHQKKGTTDPEILGRAQLFDDLFEEMMNAIKLVDSKLGPGFLVNKQVTCEVLYLPFATETPEGKLKFVGIHYDKLPAGVNLALVPFRITDATTGDDLPNSTKIVKELTSAGKLGSVMFIDNSLTQNKALDVTALVPPVENIEQLKAMLASNKLEARRQVKAALEPVATALEKAIINDPNIIGKELLGQDYEGIVINSRLGPIKVTSQEQRDVITAKNAAVAAGKEKTKELGQVDKTLRTAVVATGNFAGHRGHEQLIDLTIAKAKELGGTPFVFVGKKVGPDDPIDLNTKLETLHKLYPGVDIRLVENQTDKVTGKETQGSDFKKVEMELVKQPPYYNNILMAVGTDQGPSMTKRAAKATERFSAYEPLAHVKVSAYVTDREADKGGTGVSTTELRDALKNLPEEEAFKVWSQAYNVKKLGVDWIKHLMDIARGNMGIQQTPQQPAPQPAPVAEMRLFNALMAPKHSMQERQLDELDMFAPVTTYVRLADGTYVAASWRRNQDLATASNSASFVDIKPVSPNVAKQLGLDQRLNDPEKKYTGAATIASGGPIQATGPFGDKTINVVDIRDPKAAKDNGVPNSIFGKIAQWSQQQDQTKQGVEEATSAAVRMQRAWERQQAKSAASRKRGEELLNPKKKEEPKKDVAEAPDSKFVGFMNKTLGQKADAPVAKSSMPDFMKDAPVAGLDSMGYRAALNFGMKTLNKLTPTQKTKLSIKGENGVVSWLVSQANKQGLLITDEEDDTQGKFVEEDLQEVQDFLPEVFKDPAIKSWAFVLTDGEPLPKAPVAGPFTVSINPGLPNNNNGYANADWKDLDTLENLPDAVELAKGLAQKNPKQFIGIYDAKGKSAGFYWPGEGWRGLKEGVAEGDSGAKYKVRSIGHDAKGDYYISPSTGKKVYKKGVKVGDHENPKTGEHKSVAEGLSESVSLRDMVNVVDQHYPKYYAELSGSDISDKQFERAIVNAYKKIMQKQGVAEGDSPAMAHTAKSLSNPPKIMQHRAKRDQEREKQLQYRNISKRDEELDEKIKGADGKACWDGYRYNGTENGSDKCVKIGEAWGLEMSHAISKLFENR